MSLPAPLPVPAHPLPDHRALALAVAVARDRRHPCVDDEVAAEEAVPVASVVILRPPHGRPPTAARRRDDRGQATAEYGLVILVAGLLALGVIAWARGTGAFTDLFESVIDSLTAGM